MKTFWNLNAQIPGQSVNIAALALYISYIERLSCGLIQRRRITLS